jgi:hypothetical protein
MQLLLIACYTAGNFSLTNKLEDFKVLPNKYKIWKEIWALGILFVQLVHKSFKCTKHKWIRHSRFYIINYIIKVSWRYIFRSDNCTYFKICIRLDNLVVGIIFQKWCTTRSILVFQFLNHFLSTLCRVI